MSETIDCNPEIPRDNFPELSDQALIGIAGRIVELATRESEADPAAVLFTALTFAAASFGPISYFPVSDTNHPARLFTCIAGQSAKARKGTSSSGVEKIFRKAEEIAGLKPLEVTPGPFSSGEGIVYVVRDPSETIKPGGAPDPGVMDKRLLGLLSEFAGTLAMMKRETNSVSAVLRAMWDKGTIKPVTKHNQIKTTNAHVNFVGHITIEELLTMLSQAEIWNGFGNRLLFVAARRPKHVPLGKPMPDREVESIARELGSAIKFAETCGRITFSVEAEEYWCSIYEELSSELPGLPGVILSRSEAQVVRLSMVYALLDKSCFVERKHLDAALAAWDYCTQSAFYIFGNPVKNPQEDRILEVLQSGKELTKTDIHDLFHRNVPAVHLSALLAKMEGTGKIIKNGKGRGAQYCLSQKQAQALSAH